MKRQTTLHRGLGARASWRATSRTILFIPFSRFVGALHVDNTIWSLIFSYPTFAIRFCTWPPMGFFRSVPKEIEERALVDRATRIQMLRRVVIRVVLPGILTAAIFAFAQLPGVRLRADLHQFHGHRPRCR